MSKWSHPRHALGMLIILLLTAQAGHSQSHYAKTETHSANGVCVLCTVQNPANAVDTGIYSSFSLMKLTVSVLGANVTQRLSFGMTGRANQKIYLIMESANATLLNVTALGGLQITTYYNNVSNADTKGASSITINVLAGSSTKTLISITPAKKYDAVELKLNAGIASALTNMRVYSAWFTGIPLPVKMISFDGYSDITGNTLKWSTASEINNEEFDVERSDDGIDYTVIGSVPGSGTTNELREYSYQDDQPQAATSYYRLRQKDYDGKSELSSIISISSQIPQATSLHVVNDPMSQDIALSYESGTNGIADIDIYDLVGQRIATRRENCSAGINDYQLTGLDLPAGQYVLRCTQAGVSHVQRISRLQ